MPGYRKANRRKPSSGRNNRNNNNQSSRRSRGSSANRGHKTSSGHSSPNLRLQLDKLGLQLRDIEGDGNCLFRALGDQLEGSSNQHLRHRETVTTFMKANREDFEPFVAGDDGPCFEKYLKTLSEPGTYAGNDAIVAFSRLHCCEVVVHQAGATPWRIIGGNSRQLHLAFHASRDHYSSVRRLGDVSSSPTAIRLCPEVLETAAVDELDEDVYWEACGEEETFETAEWTTDGFGDDVVANVMAMSGCTDEDLANGILADCDFDMELAVSRLLHLVSNCEQDTPQEPNDRLNSSSEGDDEIDVNQLGAASMQPPTARPPLSASQSKRQKKQAKKERAAQRRREALMNGANSNSGNNPPSSNDEFVINGMSVLNL